MKSLILFLLLVFVSILAQAQEPDVIYLNNGNVVHGEIIGQKPGVSVKIRTTTGKEYEYKMIEIREIRKGTVIRLQSPSRTYKSSTESEKGYWTAVEASAGISLLMDKTNLVFFQFAWINGYRFSEYLRVGLGIGGRYYLNNDARRGTDIPWAFPLYLDFRGNLSSQATKRLVPYWSLDAGACIRDNFFFSPTLGLRFGGKRSDILLGLSYTGQSLDTCEGYKYTNMVSLKVGYEF